MDKPTHKSRVLGEKLLRVVLSRLDAESVAGDIEENYRDIASSRGRLSAGAWYWIQIIKAWLATLSVSLSWTGTLLKANLKMTWRNIKRQKTYSFINLTGLAVGMAVCITILVWVQYEASYDRFHNNLENLHRLILRSEASDWHDAVMVGLIPGFMEAHYPEVIHASNLGRTEYKLTHLKKTFISRGLKVNPGFLEMFTFPLQTGDPGSALEAPNSIVLTEELAQKLMGDQEALGKTIWLDDQAACRVSGVVHTPPRNSSIQFEFLVPYQRHSSLADHWGWKDVHEAYVQLRKNTSLEEFNPKISQIYNERKPPANPRQTLYLQPMKRVHLYAPGGGGLITYVYIFSAMAGVILLIACINFINLSTAASENRFREIGIRKVVGSSRLQLIKQFLGEYLLLSFISLFLSLILVQLFLPSVSTLVKQQLELKLSGTILLFITGIALLTGLISGIFPALYLSSLNPVSIIRGRFRLGGRAALRKTLVVIQFSLSIFLIVGTLVISDQMNYIRGKDLGFQTDQILKFSMRGVLARKTEAVKERLLQIPSVEAVSRSSFDMVFWNSSMTSGWYDEGGLHEAIIGTAWVDHDFLETFKIDLAAGRFFSPDFPSDIKDAYVINKAAARALGLDSAVGTRLIRGLHSPREDPGVVVGVVDDFHTQSLHQEVRPFMLIPASRGTGSHMFIRIRPENIAATMRAAESAVQEVFPNYPVSLRFLDEMVNNLYRHEHLTGNIIDRVAVLAVFLSCLGLLGLASYTVKRRTKEIGIRKVLGSSVSHVSVLFLKDFLKWVLLANLFAWPAAWFSMNAWLQRFAFRTQIGWHWFVISGILAFLIAGGTVYIHSWKAARTDPVKSLRSE